MSFASRQDAGQKLARYLRGEGVEADIVIGLPRGGVIVAAEAAHVLRRPFDVLVVRKIGHPSHREFAVGALAEHDVVLLDEGNIGSHDSVRAQLAGIIAEEKQRLQQYQSRFHQGHHCELSGKQVLIIDDGLATGATMEAAVLSAKKQGAKTVSVAVPVASRSAVLKLERIASAVFALVIDPGFQAVGAYYESFPQTGDDEVIELLHAEFRRD